MSERDTLDNNTSQILHDYASPNVKLLVGRKKVEFNVQENVLSKVTHFQKCLNLGFKEASTKTIELLDDDQEGIAQLLHWVYTGPMSDIPCDKTSVNRSQAEVQRSMSLVQSYVVADNYSVEGLTNRIVDIFITYFGGHFPIPSLITTLTEAGLETCRLRQFFVHHLARAIADARSGCARWQDYIDRDTDWEANIKNLAPDDVLDVLKQCADLARARKPLPRYHHCDWHIHETTQPCNQKKTANKG